MDTLRLSPDIGVRDITVGFDVAGRTISTHVETRRPLPVLVSLKSLTASLRGEIGSPLFVCACGRATCDDAPAVHTELAVGMLFWRVALPQGDRLYELERAQVSAELGRVVGVIASKTEQSQPGRYRFQPPGDAELFAFQSATTGRARTAFANLAYFSAVLTVVTTLAIRLLSVF